ncbi:MULTISPECIES: nitrite reductase small subunit NirD [unclassified Rothia (in: high G+C Gram-positive bacteria)]|uniref:nitrite reductase small subunit NirD n=1 Tax=unclassified Rothia (in: high G+C Gram-positive bacteria) TaxID=2689056 RepID=UPI00195BA6A3|nr:MULTISPECIES: nitrite reductase small subunit NirD [unclassified Rothia (in: high G+C Gram-positive bacteria)]MBM7050424.1 nitrite reductase small subunit NirD [Rothia sp. ZJ1223]QRZ62409.1 nitrite reductase small subunit NirD [Rothia sp. ZJ932]
MSHKVTHRICSLNDLEENWGEVALIGDHQYAIFRTHDDRVYVTDHQDPNSGSLVIARGIVGEKDGKRTVTSPLYKEIYDLETGECLSGADYVLPVYEVENKDGEIFVLLDA